MRKFISYICLIALVFASCVKSDKVPNKIDFTYLEKNYPSSGGFNYGGIYTFGGYQGEGLRIVESSDADYQFTLYIKGPTAYDTDYERHIKTYSTRDGNLLYQILIDGPAWIQTPSSADTIRVGTLTIEKFTDIRIVGTFSLDDSYWTQVDKVTGSFDVPLRE